MALGVDDTVWKESELSASDGARGRSARACVVAGSGCSGQRARARIDLLVTSKNCGKSSKNVGFSSFVLLTLRSTTAAPKVSRSTCRRELLCKEIPANHPRLDSSTT